MVHLELASYEVSHFVSQALNDLRSMPSAFYNSFLRYRINCLRLDYRDRTLWIVSQLSRKLVKSDSLDRACKSKIWSSLSQSCPPPVVGCVQVKSNSGMKQIGLSRRHEAMG
ncbi:unnamed protein product (mitochondrion) [Musa textilis]